MPYRFRLREELGAGARRIIGEQLERAIEDFASLDPDSAIHKARRRLKKARAVLRFIRPGIPDKAYKQWNADLRDVGMLFSNERDLFVIAKVAADLAERAPVRNGKAALQTLQGLAAAAQMDPKHEMRDAIIKAGVLRLQAAVQMLVSLPSDDLQISHLAEGFGDSQRASRKTYKHAFETGDDEAFHEWRKSVQRHWRQCLLLNGVWPDFYHARAAVAEKVAGLLGADHDLSILKHFAASHIDKGLTEKQAEILFALAQERQDELRAQAQIAGQALNAAKPDGLARETEIYWRSAAGLAMDPPPQASRQTRKVSADKIDAKAESSEESDSDPSPNVLQIKT
jgi:CHAD domain-containing protein